MYAIDSTMHSPLIGFAYDGFPIYGSYAYQNTNGTGSIVRMKSSYHLRNITTRTTSPTGATVPAGPNVSATYPIGYFREDYEYIANSNPDYLDAHNGRFCVTPEYPNGMYCYFATVDSNWNSSYPYVVGPTFYGTIKAAKVTSVPSGTTTYMPPTGIENLNLETTQLSIFPNPTSDLLMIQLIGITNENLSIELLDLTGRLVATTTLLQGSTIAYFDTKVLYSGQYLVKISNSKTEITKKVVVTKN